MLLIIVFGVSVQAMNAEVNNDLLEEAENGSRISGSAKYYRILPSGNFEEFFKPSIDVGEKENHRYYKVSYPFSLDWLFMSRTDGVSGCSSCFSCSIEFSFARIFRVNRGHNATANNEEEIDDGMFEIEVVRRNHTSDKLSNSSQSFTYAANYNRNYDKQIDKVLEDIIKQEELKIEMEANLSTEKRRQVEMCQFWEELCGLEVTIPNDSDYDNHLADFISLKILTSRIYPLIARNLQLNLDGKKSRITLQLWEELCGLDKTLIQDDYASDNEDTNVELTQV